MPKFRKPAITTLAIFISFLYFATTLNFAQGQTATQPKSMNVVQSNVFRNLSSSNSQIAGYAVNFSIRSGEPLVLRVRAPFTWSLEIYREGHYSGAGVDGKLILRKVSIKKAMQPSPLFLSETRTVDASNWKNTLRIPTVKWQTGLYMVKLIMGRQVGYIPFVVRTLNMQGKTVYVSSFQTMQAYNGWGGFSGYKGLSGTQLTLSNRSQMITFSRPLNSVGIKHFLDNDLGMAQIVDRYGKNVAWTTDYDVAIGRSDISNAQTIVTSSHDEYWTVENRKSFDRAIANGANVIISGGNTSYWRIRYNDNRPGNSPAFFKYQYPNDPMMTQAPELSTTYWRATPGASPESLLTAGMYNHSANTCGSSNDYQAAVVNPDWFGFAGLSVKSGQIVSGIATHELDQIIPDSKIPERTEILMHASYECTTSNGTQKSAGYDMTYYTTAAQGAVFSAGTTAWGCALSRFCAPKRNQSLVTADFVRQVTKNLLTAFSQKNIGSRYPSSFNVNDIYPGIKVTLVK